ncbi:hypothetical protein Pelo_19184 [Pelomyxa schiedti]|nr:hypothetical protein Pelo_19184 [Pelomyxa schiedti]
MSGTSSTTTTTRTQGGGVDDDGEGVAVMRGYQRDLLEAGSVAPQKRPFEKNFICLPECGTVNAAGQSVLRTMQLASRSTLRGFYFL